jgi:hypothetical protein
VAQQQTPDLVVVDVPAGKGVKAWGDLLGRFAVQAIPRAVAVDGNGTIVACGRLQDVLGKASELIRKTRWAGEMSREQINQLWLIFYVSLRRMGPLPGS